jgi:D-lactate dehydrogenase (cytochrome)
MNSKFTSALQEIVGETHLSVTEADRTQHGRDQSSHPASLPEAVIWPESTQQVSAILRLANENKIPVVGWGAGTSLEGNPIPVRGGLVVDFGRMNQIIEIHAQDFQVTVQPGILYKDMNKVLARNGLFFAPDPGANASIGGMVANNAAGIRTVKYGATRDNVLALEVVLANGEIIRTGSRSVKQSAGYDLTHLFTGSEGTLGLVTEATLKLAPLPEHFSAVTVAFPSVEAAAATVFNIIGAGLNPAALELLGAELIEILNKDAGFEFAVLPNLLMEFNGASEASLNEELALVKEICEAYDCERFEAGLGREARNRLWEARHQVFEILVRHYAGQTWSLTDVAVPISNYPELVSYAVETSRQLGLNTVFVGHAGDGNLHTTSFFSPEDQATGDRTKQLNEKLVSKALALSGTSTGEHGVGLGKQKYMMQEHGAAALTVMRQLKATLDPHNILNPGKVLG